jgi:hypothetical protein
LNTFFRSYAFPCFVRRLFIGEIAAYVLVSLILGGTSAARPAFCFLSLGCFVWLWLRRKHLAAAPKKVGRILEIVGFNLALTLLSGELALRAFAFCTGHSLMVSDSLDAYRLDPGREYGQGLRGNRLGFPGPDFQRGKRPGIFRIAALGDSFAVGPTVRYSDNYLKLLEETLPSTEVYNFGVSGIGPREYSMILNKYGWAYQSDLVLVSIFVGNDITEIMATPRRMDARQLSLYLLLTRAVRLLVEDWRGRSDRMENEECSMKNKRPAGLSLQTFREIESRRLTVCLKSPPPSLEKKWLQAELYLDRIVAECRKRKVALAFVLIPDELQVNPSVLADALDDAQLDRLAVDIQLPQRRLAGFFADRGVPCLDLLPHFSRSEDLYTPHDTHWNMRGNHLAAKCISEWLTALPRQQETVSTLITLPASAPPPPTP